MTNVLKLVANAALTRNVENMFKGFWGKWGTNSKHDFYRDFGWPETLEFDALYRMYKRNGLARAAVDKTKGRTWQGETYLLEQKRDGSQRKKNDRETVLEKAIRVHFTKLNFWQKIAEADRRMMIGGYSGILLKFADGLNWDQPVTSVAGIEGLVGLEIIWAKQLEVADWYTDQADAENYGNPKMFSFLEILIDDSVNQKPTQRTLNVHPSRLFVWSNDGTIAGESLLEAGYNDLIDFEKIKGAGGEGFWKTSRGSPILETEKEANMTFAEMAKAMDTTVEDLHKKMNDQVENWQKGFDQLLMLQGMTAKPLTISLPSPEHFYEGPLMSFAASVRMPTKVLIGNQQGDRASSEDSEEWDQTIMDRRVNVTTPLLLSLVKMLVAARALPAEKDWYIDQTDLTEAKASEKVDRSLKMAQINTASTTAAGMLTFTLDEIRETMDYEPASPAEMEVTVEEDEDPPGDKKDNPNDQQGKN